MRDLAELDVLEVVRAGLVGLNPFEPVPCRRAVTGGKRIYFSVMTHLLTIGDLFWVFIYQCKIKTTHLETWTPSVAPMSVARRPSFSSSFSSLERCLWLGTVGSPRPLAASFADLGWKVLSKARRVTVPTPTALNRLAGCHCQGLSYKGCFNSLKVVV